MLNAEWFPVLLLCSSLTRFNLLPDTPWLYVISPECFSFPPFLHVSPHTPLFSCINTSVLPYTPDYFHVTHNQWGKLKWAHIFRKARTYFISTLQSSYFSKSTYILHLDAIELIFFEKHVHTSSRRYGAHIFRKARTYFISTLLRHSEHSDSTSAYIRQAASSLALSRTYFAILARELWKVRHPCYKEFLDVALILDPASMLWQEQHLVTFMLLKTLWGNMYRVTHCLRTQGKI